MKPVQGLLRRTWDGITVYVPVLLMALLALGTWWLVRHAPIPAAATAPTELSTAPDYAMRNFAIQSFQPNGHLKSEVRGQEARHYPATDTLEIDAMQMHAMTPEGLRTDARAERALSNADGSEIQLFGNAVVTRQAKGKRQGLKNQALEFRGEFLHLWPQSERVRSHKPVVLTRGQDKFTADALEYNHLEQVLELRGRVRGVLAPPLR